MNVMNYECIYEHVFTHFAKTSEGEKKLAGQINNLNMKEFFCTCNYNYLTSELHILSHILPS